MVESPELRLFCLDLRVRLRSLGVWPWIALVGWALMARAQEPTVLRSFGIDLARDAIWSGGAILLLALLAVGAPQHPQRPQIRLTVITATALALLLGLAHASLGLAVDGAFSGRLAWPSALGSLGLFVVTWVPVGCVWMLAPATRLGLVLRLTVMTVGLLFAVVVKQGHEGSPVLAAVLGWIGAALYALGRNASRSPDPVRQPIASH